MFKLCKGDNNIVVLNCKRNFLNMFLKSSPCSCNLQAAVSGGGDQPLSDGHVPPTSQIYNPVLESKNPKSIPCSGTKNVNHISCSGVTTPSLKQIMYCIILYYIVLYFIVFYSILFYSILFYSTLLYSILFYSILLYSILFYSILFYSIGDKDHIYTLLI